MCKVNFASEIEHNIVCQPVQLINHAFVVVVVALLLYVNGKLLRSCRDGQFFLGRFRPPKRLTSTSCTYFRQ